MPHNEPFLAHASKDYNEAKGLEEHVIWEVPRHDKNPDGIRYRLAFVPVGRVTPAVLYDNHHPKGHHKHIDGEEIAYEFSGVEKLLEDFKRDIEAFHENSRN